MLGKLTVTNEFSNDLDFRIFGPALLEQGIDWPADYNGNPMIFFIGFPANLLNRNINKNMYCNIFITYDHEDDQHVYDLEESNPNPSQSSCVILSDIRYAKAKKVSCIEPGKKLAVDSSSEEAPYWLQSPIEKNDMSYRFQLYAGYIDEAFQQDFGDEIYYFFCNDECTKGSVFTQIT